MMYAATNATCRTLATTPITLMVPPATLMAAAAKRDARLGL